MEKDCKAPRQRSTPRGGGPTEKVRMEPRWRPTRLSIDSLVGTGAKHAIRRLASVAVTLYFHAALSLPSASRNPRVDSG